MTDHETSMGRRDVLAALAVTSAAITTGCAATATQAQRPVPGAAAAGGAVDMAPAFAGRHAPVPLPFDPSSLEGLSERLVTSHHENNYGGAVQNLNRVEQELATLSSDAPGFAVAALRERELTFRNSKTLHEAYFASLGGDGRRSGSIESALAETYGTTARWEEHFRATALGLGGGSGWVVLSLHLDSGQLHTAWSGHHTQVLSGAVPLLVLDMYEHAYHLDYGAGHARYIDAYFQNLRWDEVNRRLAAARGASAALASS